MVGAPWHGAGRWPAGWDALAAVGGDGERPSAQREVGEAFEDELGDAGAVIPRPRPRPLRSPPSRDYASISAAFPLAPSAAPEPCIQVIITTHDPEDLITSNFPSHSHAFVDFFRLSRRARHTAHPTCLAASLR